MDKLETRNRMTANQLMSAQGADIEFIKNPNTGKLFFACGNITAGYMSPAVQQKASEVTTDELQYAEVKKPGIPDVDPISGTSNWVPCLMMVGNSKQNVVRTLSR